MSISNLVTTPHCVCLINSVPFARCSGLTYDILSPRREVHGIDVLPPVELVPTSLSIHGTVQMYKIHFDGGNEASGLVATWNLLTKEKYFSLMVLDRVTDTVLVQADKCCVTNQSWVIQPRSFVIGTVAWTGIEYNNDTQ